MVPGENGPGAMQIERDQLECPACGAAGLELYPLLHHMICAYVGPEYDRADGRWVRLSEMPAGHRAERSRLRDCRDKRALRPLPQRGGGIPAGLGRLKAPETETAGPGPPFCVVRCACARCAAYFTCVSNAAQALATPRSGSEPGNLVHPAFSISS
jgi:hypothetical protein